MNTISYALYLYKILKEYERIGILYYLFFGCTNIRYYVFNLINTISYGYIYTKN